MGRMVCALTLLLPMAGFGQQASSPGTGATLTSGVSQIERPSGDSTTPEVQQLIHESFSSDPALANASISVRTDDRAIVLMGTVGSQKQHEAALRIAQSFTGGRQIVDKIKVGVWGSQ